MSTRCNGVAYGFIKTVIGWCGVVKGYKGVLRVFIGYQKKAGLHRKIKEIYPDARFKVDEVSAELDVLRRYLEGEQSDIIIKLDFSSCTEFEKRVYKRLQSVQLGSTITYAELARRCGAPRAFRAVARALARNPFPVVVPCHRVIRSDGSPGGFSAPGGVRLKVFLIRREKVSGESSLCPVP